MSGLSRAETLLLATASTVLVAGVVAVPLLYDDSGPSSSAPAPVPSAAPSRSAVPLTVSQLRVTTYARGSHQLVVRAVVSTGVSASLLVDAQSFPLHLVDGEVSGTVSVPCRGPVPELTLAVRTADGATLTTSLGRPSGPLAEACAAPHTGSPVPTPSGSSRGS